jgi:hypothetical protein
MESRPSNPDSPHEVRPEPINPIEFATPAHSAGRGAVIGIWLMALALAVITGTAAWGVEEAMHDYFKPSLAASEQNYIFTALNREMAQANARNGAVAFGALGGFLGLGLGLAGGLSRRSIQGIIYGMLSGLLLGAAAGALPSFVVMPWQWQHRYDDLTASTLVPLMIHAALWCGLGLTAGLSYAVGYSGFRLGRLGAGALGGLVGAAVGTLVYETTGALLFPQSRTDEPFAATAATRLLAPLCIALFVALGALLNREPRATQASKPATVEPPHLS